MTLVHVRARHRPRGLSTAAEPVLGRAHDFPIARFKRLVHSLPHQPRGALGAGVANLQGDARLAVGMREIHDASISGGVIVAVHSGAGPS